MDTEPQEALRSGISKLLVRYPLYQFRKEQERGYLLRILVAAEYEALAPALGEILSNGQLLDTRLEMTVYSETAQADGKAILEASPELHRFVQIDGLDQAAKPKEPLAWLNFRTELEINQQDWDYVLICGGQDHSCREAIKAWDFDPCQLVACREETVFSDVFQDCRTERVEAEPEEKKLKEIAFNMHYGYQKYNSPRASLPEIQAGFDKEYNKNATLKNVMHIRSKLACCGILDPDLTMAAGKFAARMKEDPEIVGRLAVLEHNRWMLEKMMKGIRRPEKLEQLYRKPGERTHSERDKWHVCIEPCSMEHRLTWSDWCNDDPDKDRPELDELDRMSLTAHRICWKVAENNRSFIMHYLDGCRGRLHGYQSGDAQKDTYAMAYLQDMETAVSQMYQKKRIAAHRYDKSKRELLGILAGDESLAADQIRKDIEDVDSLLEPLREYIIDKDYKEQDYLMVKQIPFALTNKVRPVLAKFFDTDTEDCQFAPWQMEPSKMVYIAYAHNDGQISDLRERAERIRRFLGYSCNEVADQYHILVPNEAVSEQSDDAGITIHGISNGETLTVIRDILDRERPDYIDMTGSCPALHSAVETYAGEKRIGTFYVRDSVMYNVSGAEELEYPRPLKGITVREMFEQTGAVLAGCESSRMSDLSNVYRDFWKASRTTKVWKQFCDFISDAYQGQKTQKTYALYKIRRKATAAEKTVRLHAEVLAKLLPAIREMEHVSYMRDIRIKWIVGNLLELSFRMDDSKAADRLEQTLSEIDCDRSHDGSCELKWETKDKTKPIIQIKKLKLAGAALPPGCEDEYTRILERLAKAKVITNLKIKEDKVTFEFASQEFLTALRNSGKVLEYNLYYTALRECQFDDVEMSWLFFHSAEDGAAENELDVICTCGTRSLFISAKNINLDTFKDSKYLNYVCYEVSVLARSFGIQAKTILASPNVPQFENGCRSRLVNRAMSRGVYLLGDRCFEEDNLRRVLENIVNGEAQWCEFLLK